MPGAPGVTFETVDLNRPRIARLRTDICGFVGYTERGPVDLIDGVAVGRPVKLESWRQFLDAFGPPLDNAYTGHAVRLFFENGGAACYMVRVVAPAAIRTAARSLTGSAGADVLDLTASFSAIDRARTLDTGPTSAPPAIQTESPGAWGNRIAVMVQPAGLGTTETLANQPADGASVRVGGIAGFAAGSHVRLSQDGVDAARYATIATIDPQLAELVWATPIGAPGLALGFDLARPVRLETVEFTLVVLLDGQEVARHADLSLSPGHRRFVVRVLAEESALVAATPPVPAPDLTDPANWPAPGTPLQLSRGRDGLAEIVAADFLAALERFETIDEIAVLAAPDAVLRAVSDEPEPSPVLPGSPCKLLEPPAKGMLRGIVIDAGEGVPVRAARITTTDPNVTPALTDAGGLFTLHGLAPGQATVRIDRAGYIDLTATAQAFAVPPLSPARFEITPRVNPVALTHDEIFAVQSAMILQGERGFYRVALLDPPHEMLEVDALRSWRNRFDTSFAALYWPWIVSTGTGTLSSGAREMPPSGAVAGLVARTDLAEGPHRAPANKQLRDVQALSHTVDDATHGLLNALGINCLRARPGRGIAPQGARTLSSASEWRFLSVRRLMLMIAEAMEDAHQWAAFEPNNRLLRDALTHSLTGFLGALWRQGALAGGSPQAAFAVKCDDANNPPAVIDAGQVVAQIAVAPVKPYEFILLRLGRTDRIRVQVAE